MKNRMWMIALLMAMAFTLSACAEGVLPSDLPADLQGLESIELEISGEGDSASIDEIEVTGIVSVISDSAWTIAGQNFLLTPQTEIKGALDIGDVAKVHAFLGEGGEVFAREIEPADDDDESQDDDSEDDEITDLEQSGHEIEFVGTVESMEISPWMISGREVVVTDQTEVKGLIAEGTLVKVHASFVDGEGLVAREIEPAEEDELSENDMDEDEDLKLKGYVESIDEESVVVDGVTFYFTDFTEFEDEIAVGDFVEIYFLDQDGQNLVREIELEDLDDDHLEDNDEMDDDDDDEDDEDDEDDDHDDEDDHDEVDDDHDDEEHESDDD